MDAIAAGDNKCTTLVAVVKAANLVETLKDKESFTDPRQVKKEKTNASKEYVQGQ